MNVAEELRKEGKIEKAKEIALNLLKKGMILNEIAEVTGLSKEEIAKLKKEYNL